MSDKPRYKVGTKAFIAPFTVEAGSIIETTAPPSLTWEPLNAAAEAEMEKLYNKEYTHFDDKGAKVVTHPHQDKRPREIVNPNADRPTIELIAGPTVDTKGELSLAEASASNAQPDLIAQGDGTSRLAVAGQTPATPARSGTEAPAPGSESLDGGTTIVAPAPTTSPFGA